MQKERCKIPHFDANDGFGAENRSLIGQPSSTPGNCPPESGHSKFRFDAYFTFSIFTILPFACGSLGSFTTVTYKSLSPSPNATLVVPAPAAT